MAENLATVRFIAPLKGRELVDMALQAIHLNLSPVPLPPGNQKHQVTAYMPATAISRLDAAGSRNGLSTLGESLAQHAYAYHLYQAVEHLEREKASSPGETEFSKNQRLLREELISGVTAGQFVLAEASTGSGKSRVLGELAQRILADSNENRIWVSAPTIAILRHLISEFSKVGIEEPALLLGRKQFVSIKKTREVLEELREKASSAVAMVEEWLNAGAPPLLSEAKTLATKYPELSHLADDLASLAPEIPLEDCILQVNTRLGAETDEELDDADTKDAEPALRVISALNERAKSSRVTMLTHAMLIVRSRSIPHDQPLPCTHMLIDEAHALEETAARVCSSDLSLRSLRQWLIKSGLSHGSAGARDVDGLIYKLRTCRKDFDSYGLKPEVAQNIRDTLTPIGNILRKGRKGDDSERGEFLASISQIISAPDNHLGLAFSPVLSLPRVLRGPGSVSGTLTNLWKRTKGGALVSATLRLPDFSGTLSFAYMASKLALPQGATRFAGPFIGSWNFKPTLHLPTPETAPFLCYPANTGLRADAEDEAESANEATPFKHSSPNNEAPLLHEKWIKAVANQVGLVAESARGGVLVLSPAYSDLKSLAPALPHLANRLILHSRTEPFSQQRERFMAAARSGLRPVWLATGTAWVGIDLRDQSVPPEEDFILTDLVILRAPIRLNATSTHFARFTRLGFAVEIAEAAVLLRQGIGRLVRAEGQRDRHLWILDGRIFGGDPKRKALASLRSVFDGYANKVPLPSNGDLSRA